LALPLNNEAEYLPAKQEEQNEQKQTIPERCVIPGPEGWSVRVEAEQNAQKHDEPENESDGHAKPLA